MMEYAMVPKTRLFQDRMNFYINEIPKILQAENAKTAIKSKDGYIQSFFRFGKK